MAAATTSIDDLLSRLDDAEPLASQAAVNVDALLAEDSDEEAALDEEVEVTRGGSPGAQFSEGDGGDEVAADEDDWEVQVARALRQRVGGGNATSNRESLGAVEGDSPDAGVDDDGDAVQLSDAEEEELDAPQELLPSSSQTTAVGDNSQFLPFPHVDDSPAEVPGLSGDDDPLAVAEEVERRHATGGRRTIIGAQVAALQRSWTHSPGARVRAAVAAACGQHGEPQMDVAVQQLGLGSHGLLRASDFTPLTGRLLGSEHGVPQCVASSVTGVAVGMAQGSILFARSSASAAASAAAAALSGGADSAAAAAAAASAAAAAASAGDGSVITLPSPSPSGDVGATCVAFNPAGDWLLAGYVDGMVRLWDVSKSPPSIVKDIKGAHKAPVVCAALLTRPGGGGGGSGPLTPLAAAAGGQTDALTADTSGFAARHTIFGPLTPLLMRCRTTRLAEKTLVLDIHALPPPLPAPARVDSATAETEASSAADGDGGSEQEFPEFVGLVAVVTPSAIVLMCLHPEPRVVAKLPRPGSKGSGDTAQVQGDCSVSSELVTPACAWAPRRRRPGDGAPRGAAHLAVSWGAVVRVYAVTLRSTADKQPQTAQPPGAPPATVSNRFRGADLALQCTWTSSCGPVIGLAWNDDVALTAITSRRWFVLIDPHSDSGAHSHGHDPAAAGSHHRVAVELDRVPCEEPAVGTTTSGGLKCHASALARRGGTVYLLGPSRLRTCKLLGWRERCAALASVGDWPGALETAVRVAHGDAQALPPPAEAPPGRAVQAASAACDLLAEFVEQRLSQDDSTTRAAHAMQLATAAACVCLTLGACAPACSDACSRALFGPALRGAFTLADLQGAFLTALVPFVLADLLPALPPEVVHDLIAAHGDVGDGDAVERCVLHLDIGSLDFDQVSRLCSTHGLHAALAHLYTRGLDDFTAPADAMLAAARSEARSIALPSKPVVHAWHRLLLYLRESFRGRRFPPGRGTLPADRVPRLKAELLGWILSDEDGAEETAPYPRLRFLLACDAVATLSVLREAFDGWDATESDVPIRYSHNAAQLSSMDSGTDAGRSAAQLVVEAVVLAAELSAISSGGLDEDAGAVHLSSAARASCLGFAAAFVGSGRASAPGPVVLRLAVALAVGPPPPGARDARLREAELISLLASSPETAAHPDVLAATKHASFHQAEAYIHCTMRDYSAALEAASADEDYPQGACDLARCLLGGARLHPSNAASSLELDMSTLPPPRAGGAAAAVRALEEAEALESARKAASDALPALAKSSPAGAALLVATCMPHEGLATALLRLGSDPDTQFAFLSALVTGAEEPRRAASAVSSAGPRSTSSALTHLLQAVPPEDADALCEAYLGLLCKYDPAAVAPFLVRGTAPCRLDAALRLVQAAHIADATAVLLERAGRPVEAMQVLLAEWSRTIAAFKSTVAAAEDDDDADSAGHDACAQARAAVSAALDDAISLCSRNSIGCSGLDVGATTRTSVADTSIGDDTPDSPTGLWLTLLDAVLSSMRSITAHWADEAYATMLRDSIDTVLLAMQRAVPPSVVAAHVVARAAELGSIRTVLTASLSSAACHRAVFVAAAAAVAADAAASNAETLAQRRRAVAAVELVEEAETSAAVRQLPPILPARTRRVSLTTPVTPPRVKR